MTNFYLKLNIGFEFSLNGCPLHDAAWCRVVLPRVSWASWAAPGGSLPPWLDSLKIHPDFS